MIDRYIHKYTFRYLSKIPLFFILIIFEFKLVPCVRMNQSGVIILKIIGHVPYVSFFCVFNSSSLRIKKIMYREDVFLCSTSGHGCVHTYCPYFGKTADCTTASASVHWPWFSKKNLQPQGLQIFFREPWPKYKSFGIVQSLVFPKLGQVLIEPVQLQSFLSVASVHCAWWILVLLQEFLALA